MSSMAPRSDGECTPAVTPLVVLKQIMAFCLLLKPHKTPAERLSEKTNRTLSQSRDVVTKAKNGCPKAKRLLNNQIKYLVKFPWEFRINWVEEELPEEMIVLIAQKVRQVSLKRYSAASIIRYYYLVNRLVVNGGTKKGIPCAECRTMCLYPYRIACEQNKEVRLEKSGLCPTAPPRIDNWYCDGEDEDKDDDELYFANTPNHHWFCSDCHSNHLFSWGYNGYNTCKCGV